MPRPIAKSINSNVLMLGLGGSHYRCSGCAFVGNRDRERVHPVKFTTHREALVHLLAHQAAGHSMHADAISILIARYFKER